MSWTSGLKPQGDFVIEGQWTRTLRKPGRLADWVLRGLQLDVAAIDITKPGDEYRAYRPAAMTARWRGIRVPCRLAKAFVNRYL